MSANPISSDWGRCKFLPAQCWGSGPGASYLDHCFASLTRAQPDIPCLHTCKQSHAWHFTCTMCESSEGLWHAWFNSSTPSVNCQYSTSIFVLNFLQIFSVSSFYSILVYAFWILEITNNFSSSENAYFIF